MVSSVWGMLSKDLYQMAWKAISALRHGTDAFTLSPARRGQTHHFFWLRPSRQRASTDNTQQA